MFRRVGVLITLVAGLCAPAATASAQGAGGIAGVVRDTSGGVMPGVTVEASSPALIEKVRSVVSDAEGQYKIVDLRPGTYTVTFTLPGFSTVKREGIEISAGFTATVNADLKVGGLEETITVSGQSPVVDTQNVVQQKVITREILDAVPSSRSNYAALTPGASRSTDVGGSNGTDSGSTFTIHGSRALDVRRLIDGMRWNSMEAANAGTGFYYDPTGAEEIALQLGSNSAEFELGGVQVNLVPKAGANKYNGYFYAGYTNNSLNSTAVPDDLKARGLPTIGAVDYVYDYSGSLGGPIVKDKLWFFTAQRWWGNSSFVPNDYYNVNTAAWLYVPDLSRPAVNDNSNRHNGVRVTWQINQKHKLNLSFDDQGNCVCHGGLTAAAAPEGTYRWNFGPPNYIVQGTWSHPHTNKLLFEGGATTLIFTYVGLPTETLPEGAANQISVLDVSKNFRYRSNGGFYNFGTYGNKVTDQSNQRFAMSYVTGTHNFKTGIQTMEGWRRHEQAPPGSLEYYFNGPTPITIVQYATPNLEKERLNMNLGLFAQDQWTIKKLTLNLGIRYDYLNASAEATDLPAGPFTPARNFPAIGCLPCWNDINPRLGAAYDIFGNGRTAIKGAIGRYVAGQAVDIASALHPVNASVYSVTRNWTDSNGDYHPDCDLTNRFANGECGQVSDLNFGQNNPKAIQYAPDVLNGWGARGYSWQANISLQHELAPGIGLNVAYFRTWYGNFNVTTNTALTPADFNSYCVTAPVDPRIPGGGGYPVCGNFDVTPAKFGQAQTVIEQASKYGEQFEHYNGIDVTVQARVKKLLVSGGLNTGRTETNDCAVVTNNPQVTAQVQGTNDNAAGPSVPRSPGFCDIVNPWHGQTQVKLAAIYTFPWAIQTSMALQSYPGQPQLGSYVYSNAQIAPSLGRNLASCGTSATCTGTSTITFEPNYSEFEDRYNQFDIRFAKDVKVYKTHVQGIVDLFNAFNARPVLALTTRYSGTTGGSFLSPTSTLVGRLIKFSAQINF
jgi:Carboxypeptidase regulatory-like domain/TonB dependent receptor-like, beta-barrel